MRKLTTLTLAMIVTAVLGSAAQADDIIVDIDSGGGYDYTTIGAAITAAGTGDTIIVRPGTYVENINMSGKAITLRSTDPTNPVVVTSTIIDGGASGSVITCSSGETSATIINGFVITNGFVSLGGGLGGGMHNSSSSPTVSNCTFSGNTADGLGGGMFNEGSSPDLSNCTFNGNTSVYGGGMGNYSSSSPTLSNCTFSGNTSTYGGGMANLSFSSPELSNCTFNGNTSIYGGGMYNSSSSPTLSNCTFSGNTADYYGGVMYNSSSSPTLSNCTFSGNTADYYYGGVMYNILSSSPTVSDSFFCFNEPDTIYGNPLDDNSGGNSMEFCAPPRPIAPEGDIDGDGDVDMTDFVLMAANWLEGT